MDLQIRRTPGLPRLAWLVRIREGRAVAHVGDWVAVGVDWWADGPWNGPLADGGFAEATFFTGSGGALVDGRIRFATASHTFEHIYSVDVGDQLWVSNSLVAMFQTAGIEPDPGYSDYAFDIINSLRKGIQTEPVVLHDGIRIHTAINFTVGPDRTMDHHLKPVAPSPNGFSGLQRLLVSTIEAVFSNAADSSWPQPFRPVATLSRGYDSVAVASLAAGLGCREAVVSLDPRMPQDDGTPVGQALGMSVTSYPRQIPDDLDPVVVAEFMASPAGTDLPRAVMADQLEGALLLIGNQGDSIFGGRPAILPDYVHPSGASGSGSSMAEFRRRVGMQLFPVPAIAALYPDELADIIRSPEMRSWSVGGAYDRPIARRIAEEAGVPRELFGQEKLATSHWWVNRSGLPERAQESFYRWFQRSVTRPPGRGGVTNRLARVLHRRWFAWVKGGYRGLPRGLRRPLSGLLLWGWRRPHQLYGSRYLYTFHWAVGVVRDRYQIPDEQPG